MRHPAPTVAEVPSEVGRLPTITQPLRNATRAVVRPTPPGHGPGSSVATISAKSSTPPLGLICTMVVPLPCWLALLLKLLTRMLPATSFPAVTGTKATPYGFRSPLAGIVEAIWSTSFNAFKSCAVERPAVDAVNHSSALRKANRFRGILFKRTSLLCLGG